MFYFKGCDKCNGDLHLESDTYGAFLKCMQCGRITEADSQKTEIKDRRDPGSDCRRTRQNVVMYTP